MKHENYTLFTIGPTQMYQSTLEVRAKIIPYFRTPEFSEIMLENEQLIKKLQFADQDSKVVFLAASGSGAMEATVINCFDATDKLLVISGGTFGERFEQICRIHHIPYEPLKLAEDEELQAFHFEPFEKQGFTGLLVNIDETYTGQLYDIKIIKQFCNRNNLFLVVDAISSFLADPYYMKKNNIDATIVSSQKGLCLAPGLSIITISPRMAERVAKNTVESLYFDFKDYFLNMERGQTPFTPAVGICFELNDMLHIIDNQGVENRVKEVADRCDYFRNSIKGLPLHLPPYPLSNAITPVRFEKDIAMEFFTYLKNERHIMVNPVGGKLGSKSIRVAHVGDLGFSDYDNLIKEIKQYFEM